jgi:hypothetical protein
MMLPTYTLILMLVLLTTFFPRPSITQEILTYKKSPDKILNRRMFHHLNRINAASLTKSGKWNYCAKERLSASTPIHFFHLLTMCAPFCQMANSVKSPIKNEGYY